MKNLLKHTYNKANALVQFGEYQDLLRNNQTLSESKDILPFFKKSPDLNLLICYHLPKLRQANCYASEFDIWGDFKADMIVGDSITHQYLLVEFEDGKPDSIFKTNGQKQTPDWSKRFEGAHSQLLDWLWKIEDMRGSRDFLHTFGSSRAKFSGIIITGKDMNLQPQELDRLDWRTSKTIVESTHLMCVSFDELLDNFQHYISIYN
ncbi:Shedu immune nuclease family protein [Enterobacter hormaechei]|uniref:Shedu immune nuclease family protein n=1 Tax=Enterobacter hormaechei TaxID=158836 RepID=UPI003F44390B